jgi:hypothetical protein
MKQVNQLSLQQNKNNTNGHQQSANTFQNYQQPVVGGGYHATNNTTKPPHDNNNSSIHEKYLNKVLSKTNSIPVQNTLSTTYQNSLTNQHEMLAKSKSANNFNNQIMIPHQIMLPTESNEFINNGLPIKKLKNDLYTSSSPHSILTGTTKSIANTADFYKNSSQLATIQNMNKHNRKPNEADFSTTNIKPPFQSVPSKAEILNNSAFDTSKFAFINTRGSVYIGWCQASW